MNSVDFTRVLSTAIQECERNIVKWVLRTKDEKYVLPRMEDVDLATVLLVAIKGH